MNFNFYKKNSGKVILLFYVFLFSSCVYFNTFYNAKVAYKDALRIINLMNYAETQIPPESKRLLDLSIANSRVVLEKYPNSKHVEEAYYLLASSMYLKEDYISSKEYLNTLISNYLNGKYYNEARLRLASIYVKENNLALANESIKDFLIDNKLNRYEKYLLNIIYAEMHTIDKNIDLAYKSYQDAIGNARNDSERIKIYNSLIQLSEKEKDYENLLVFIDGLYENLSDDRDKKELKLLSLEYNKRLKRYDFLTYEIENMLNQSLFEDKRMFLSVELAKAYYYLEDYATTEELLLEVVDIYSRKNETAEAYYFLAQINIKNDFNLEIIKELLNKSKSERSSSKYGKLSKELIRKLEKLEDLGYEYANSISEEPDNNLVSLDSDSLLFDMGQSYYFDFNQIDSAVTKHKELITKFSSSKFIPKSLFVLSILDSTDENWFKRLQSEHPDYNFEDSNTKDVSSSNYYSEDYYEALNLLDLGFYDKAYPILKESYLNNENTESLFYLGYLNEIYTSNLDDMLTYYIEYLNKGGNSDNKNYVKEKLSLYYYLFNKQYKNYLSKNSLYECINRNDYDYTISNLNIVNQDLSDILKEKYSDMNILNKSWSQFKKEVKVIDSQYKISYSDDMNNFIDQFNDKVSRIDRLKDDIMSSENSKWNDSEFLDTLKTKAKNPLGRNGYISNNKSLNEEARLIEIEDMKKQLEEVKSEMVEILDSMDFKDYLISADEFSRNKLEMNKLQNYISLYDNLTIEENIDTLKQEEKLEIKDGPRLPGADFRNMNFDKMDLLKQ